MNTAAEDIDLAIKRHQLGSGDAIRILIFQNPDLTMEARVSESGTVNYPLIGTVRVPYQHVEMLSARAAEIRKAVLPHTAG